MSEDSNKVVGFEIRLKDGVSKSAQNLEDSIKAATISVREAIKAAEKHERALANQKNAMAAAETAHQNWQKAVEKTGLDSEEAAASLNKSVKATEKLVKANERLASAEARKSATLAAAKRAIENVSGASKENVKTTRQQAREINSLSRAFAELVNGNIRGAIRALGPLGTQFIAVAGVVGAVTVAVQQLYKFWKRMADELERTKADRVSAELNRIGKEIDEIGKSIDRTMQRFDRMGKIADHVKDYNDKIASAQRRQQGARDEAAFQESMAGVTDPSERSEKMRARQRQQLFSEAEELRQGINRQRKAWNDELKRLQAEQEMIQQKSWDAESREVAARSEASGAVANRDKFDRGSEKWGYWNEVASKANEKIKSAMKEQADVAKRINEIEDRRVAIQREGQVQAEEYRASLAEIEAKVKGIQSTEDTEAAKRKQALQAAQEASNARIAGLQAEQDARSDARKRSMEHAVEVANRHNDPNDINAVNQNMVADAEFLKAPYRAALEAAREAREEAERMAEAEKQTDEERIKSAERLAEARLREKDAAEELAAKDAELAASNAARLNEMLKREDEIAKKRKDAADEQVAAAEKALAVVTMADVDAEAAGQERAREAKKSREKYKNTLANAERQWNMMQGVGATDDQTAWNVTEDEFGNAVVGGTKEQQAAFRRLNKRDRAAILAEARKRQAKNEALNAQNNANIALDNAANNLQLAAANLAALDTKGLVDLTNKVMQQGQINLNAGG